MIATKSSLEGDPAARLDELARLLAEAILRARHRRILKEIPARGTREKELELVARTSTHGTRNGELTP